jgi:hypothetical protein
VPFWIGKCRTGQELVATEALLAARVDAWTPKSIRLTKPRKKRRAVAVIFGSFPSYLFVRATTEIPHVELERAATSLLVIDGWRATVDEAVIEGLQALGEYLEDRRPPTREKLRRGAIVIARSPMLGSVRGQILRSNGSVATLELSNGLVLSIPLSQIAARL